VFTKKSYLKFIVGLSSAPAIAGLLMAIFRNSADDRVVGLLLAIIGPAAIWVVFGCAFFVFKKSLFCA
jgi:hypothetical protein